MTTLVLSEYGRVEAVLDDDTAAALAATGAVAVTPARGGAWDLTAGHHVGVVSAGDVTVLIRPKMPVARLLFLLGYAVDPKAWRADPADVGDGADLWPAMAQLFVRHAERAVAPGLLQGYRVEDATLHVMRGRLREADQMRYRPGLLAPVEVRFDEYDSDIAENRLLRAAGERLLRVPGMPPAAQRRLRALLFRVGDVRRLRPGAPLPATVPSRLNARYQPALALARLVLQGRSVEVAAGERRVSGFLFDMNKVFEDFVTVGLTEALAQFGGRCRSQDPHPLDVARRVSLMPDLVRYVGGRVAAVFDAKYKSPQSGSARDDTYQMLAYCTVLGLRHGDLVYASGTGRRHVVRNAGITVVQHTLDLGVPAPLLLDRVAAVAREVAQRPAVGPVLSA